MQDLEIYIRDLELAKLTEWLGNQLDNLVLSEPASATAAIKGAGDYRGHRVRISAYPGASGKRYTSLVLEADELPWNTDLECARSAWRAMDGEIRCSQGEWQEGEPVEEEKWWRLDDRGEQLVAWN